MQIAEFEHSRHTDRREKIQRCVIAIELKDVVHNIRRAEPEGAEKI